eukprot:536198_1
MTHSTNVLNFQITYFKLDLINVEPLLCFNFLKQITSHQHIGDTKKKDGVLSSVMATRYKKNIHVLPPKYEEKLVFISDFGPFIQTTDKWHDITFLNNSNDTSVWYKVLLQQYPNSKFILNIRNVNNWIKSRYTFQFHQWFAVEKILNKFNETYKNEMDVINAWKQLWYQYICDIISYFKHNRTIQNDLLIFDIENDSIDKLTNFFQQFGLYLNGEAWGKVGGYPTRHTADNKDRFDRWNQIITHHSEFANKVEECKSLLLRCHINDISCR